MKLQQSTSFVGSILLLLATIFGPLLFQNNLHIFEVVVLLDFFLPQCFGCFFCQTTTSSTKLQPQATQPLSSPSGDTMQFNLFASEQSMEMCLTHISLSVFFKDCLRFAPQVKGNLASGQRHTVEWSRKKVNREKCQHYGVNQPQSRPDSHSELLGTKTRWMAKEPSKLKDLDTGTQEEWSKIPNGDMQTILRTV